MPNYKESTVAGSSHQRAWRLEVENPITGPKGITFHEEVAVTLESGDPMTRYVGSLTKAYSEGTKDTEFDLLNPETGEVIGTMTHGELYAALYSLYIQCAIERDAAEAIE